MSLNLSCPCGYQGVASAEEAQELIWCPQCRRVLHQPRSYTAAQGRTFANSGMPLAPRPRTAPTPSGGGAGARIAGGIAVAVMLGVLRAACSTSSYHDYDYSPTYTPPPRFDPVIVQQPPVDWQQFQPAGPGPFGQPAGGDIQPPVVKEDEIIFKGADGREIRIPLKADPVPGGNPFGKPPGPEDDR
jgi:hypothetical protein